MNAQGPGIQEREADRGIEIQTRVKNGRRGLDLEALCVERYMSCDGPRLKPLHFTLVTPDERSEPGHHRSESESRPATGGRRQGHPGLDDASRSGFHPALGG